jgi:glyoxylase-like metal-dependent hydrolase (beta-lactamase superfamily II)
MTTDGVCFAGDLVLGLGSTIVPPGGGSLAAYMDSLALLQAEEIELICPGHGPWITDPEAKLAEYVEHRRMRERKLLAALDSGECSRAALLAEAWSDIPIELLPMAAMAMESHLEKLEGEGRLPGDLRE